MGLLYLLLKFIHSTNCPLCTTDLIHSGQVVYTVVCLSWIQIFVHPIDKCYQFAKYFNKLICVIYGAPDDIPGLFDYTVTVFQIF